MLSTGAMKEMNAANDDTAGHEAEPAGTRPRVRDRIFDTACELFYRHGIRSVGVDAIAAEAGTNKMSFYRSFPSKDDLVAEYLREQQREVWKHWDAAIAAHPDDPRRQIEALFEAHLVAVEDKACRGCALGNAAVEIADDEDVLSQLVRHFKKEVRRRLRKMARATGARDPDALGDQLMLLMDGGYFTRLAFPGNTGPIAALMPAVRALIASQLPPEAAR
jgi:AcrR family transcriptional regulator